MSSWRTGTISTDTKLPASRDPSVPLNGEATPPAIAEVTPTGPLPSPMWGDSRRVVGTLGVAVLGGLLTLFGIVVIGIIALGQRSDPPLSDQESRAMARARL